MSRVHVARSADPHGRAPRSGHSQVPALALANARRRPGEALSERPRTALSAHLGVDLCDVRVHRDEAAARAAEAFGARALTVGQHIYFGQGMYDPASREGMRLLTHEAAHTVQQRGAAETDTLEVSRPGDATERAADRAVSGDRSALGAQAQVGVQRDILGTGINALRDMYDVENLLHAPDAVYRIFKAVNHVSILTSSGIILPPLDWIGAVASYAATDLTDGYMLARALKNVPIFHRGGLILTFQPGASAMTLDHDVFVDGDLSLKTFVHELTHVTQYDVLGIDLFLASYFGMSAATIAYRWATGAPTNPMRSSPHENQAYDLASRFEAWYQTTYGKSAANEKV